MWNLLVKISMGIRLRIILIIFKLSFFNSPTLHMIAMKVINLESQCRSFGLLPIFRVFKNRSCDDDFGMFELKSCTCRYIKSEFFDQI